MAIKDFMPWERGEDFYYRREYLGDLRSVEEQRVAFDRIVEQQRQAEYIRQNVQAMVSDFVDRYSGEPRTEENLTGVRMAVSNMLTGLQRQGMLPEGELEVSCTPGEHPGQVNVRMAFPSPVPLISVTLPMLPEVIEEEIPKILKQPKIIQSSTPIEPEEKPRNRFKELLF